MELLDLIIIICLAVLFFINIFLFIYINVYIKNLEELFNALANEYSATNKRQKEQRELLLELAKMYDRDVIKSAKEKRTTTK